MRHAMIDVEALRLNQPWIAPLMQMGIVIFDEEANQIQAYEINVEQSTLPEWATPEKSTQEFWEQQELWPDLQQKMVTGDSAEKAIKLLGEIYFRNCCEAAWFAGPTYDQVMLEAYFDHYGIKRPWKYNDSRDFRTIRKQYGSVLENFPDNPNLHSAMDDCMHQVARLRHITLATGFNWS